MMSSWADTLGKTGSFRDRFDYIYRNVTGWTAEYMPADGGTVLDFGCGSGVSALRFALEHPDQVVHGIDISDTSLGLAQLANNEIGLACMPANLQCQQILSSEYPFPDATFDLIFSWSVFEHINENLLATVVKSLHRILKPTGICLVQISPLYFSARGSHLYHYLDMPWAHLLMQHDNLRTAVFDSPMGNPSKKQFYWDSYEALNRITADELTHLFTYNGFSHVREESAKESRALIPPDKLISRYRSEVLTTRSIICLFRKSTSSLLGPET